MARAPIETDLLLSSAETASVVCRKGEHHQGSVRAQLATLVTERYTQGASIRAICAETGLSYGKVHRLLNENQITLRPRGGNTRNR